MSLAFLDYFENEMNYLMEEGKIFKQKYPNMSNLDFSNTSCDPDIKRLIESIAFLNAKLNQRIEKKNPELNQEILNNIYPYFNRPIPSFCIFHIPEPSKALTINNNTKISLQSKNKEQYTFLTTHKIHISSYKILNIKKSNADLLPKDIAKFTENTIEITLEKIFNQTEKEMILYINNIDEFPNNLYEALFTFHPTNNTPVFENEKQIGEIVPMEDFDILPKNMNENTTYKPVIEFNSFKQKFLFFKIIFFKYPIEKIYIPIKQNKKFSIKNNSFLLNCFIGVNLIEKISEPIFLDNTKHTYPIKFAKNYDIYEIQHINSLEFPERKYINYFSLDYNNRKDNDLLWITKKEITTYVKNNLYLLNNTFENQTLYVKALCAQKSAHEEIMDYEVWNIGQLNIKCINIKKPTKYNDNLNKEEAQRTLISHLFLNYFGLENDDILIKLKELFNLYNNENNIQYYFSLIKNISIKTQMIPFKGNMIPKMYIIMKVKDDPNIFLFSQIVAKLLRNNLNMNNKADLTLIKDETNEVWKQCNLI